MTTTRRELPRLGGAAVLDPTPACRAEAAETGEAVSVTPVEDAGALLHDPDRSWVVCEDSRSARGEARRSSMCLTRTSRESPPFTLVAAREPYYLDRLERFLAATAARFSGERAVALETGAKGTCLRS